MFEKIKLSLTRLKPCGADFLALAALAILIHVTAVALGICPQGSTFSSYQAFYGFYTGFLYHGEITQWLPYTAYGMQAGELMLRWITPSMYLAGLAGALLRIQDTLWLFRIGLTFETLMLLTGVTLLARYLFRRRSAILFVGIGILGSTTAFFEVNWNFRIFYLMPLIFYFLLRFSRDQKPYFLWWACSALILSQIGVPEYHLPFQGAVFVLALGLLAVRNAGTFSCLLSGDKKNILSFSGFVLTALLYGYFFVHRLDHLQTVPSTLPNGLTALPLKDFLGQNDPGSLVGLEKLLGFFWESAYDFISSIYVGILPIVFALYACLRMRSRLFWGILALLTFLVFFSAGDPFGVARTLYSLVPPLRTFPHIGYLGGFIRPFVIFIAGLGLEGFLNDLAPRGANKRKTQARQLLFGCGFFVFILMIVLSHFIRPSRLFLTPSSFFYLGQYSAFLAVLLCTFRTPSARGAGWVLVLLFALDILSNANLSLATTPLQPSANKRKVFEAAPLSFQPARGSFAQLLQTPSRSLDAFQVSIDHRVSPDITMSSFVLYDSCLPLSDNDRVNQNVARLFGARFEGYRQINSYPQLLQTDLFPPQDYASFQRIMGCSEPKLRLSNDVVFARNAEEAAQMLGRDTRTVLEDPAQTGLPKTGAQTPAGVSGTVEVSRISFNRLEARAEVTDPEGAWLYYADAYHPGWKASVDGRLTLIRRANLAFKAIHLKKGRHTVRFWFFPGLQGIASYLLAVFAVLFAGILAAMMIRLTFSPIRPSRLNE